MTNIDNKVNKKFGEIKYARYFIRFEILRLEILDRFDDLIDMIFNKLVILKI